MRYHKDCFGVFIWSKGFESPPVNLLSVQNTLFCCTWRRFFCCVIHIFKAFLLQNTWVCCSATFLLLNPLLQSVVSSVPYCSSFSGPSLLYFVAKHSFWCFFVASYTYSKRYVFGLHTVTLFQAHHYCVLLQNTVFLFFLASYTSSKRCVFRLHTVTLSQAHHHYCCCC